MELEAITFTNKIKQQLKNSKPGLKAQQLMMPENRNAFPTNELVPVKSAVLIALYIDSDHLMFPLIRRPIYNGNHSGQMALPGGKFEETDKNLIHTALRESFEEIGVIPSKVKVLGTLTELYIPITNIMVLPVVGLLEEIPEFVINRYEVDELFKVKLSALKNHKNKKTETWQLNGNHIKIPFYNLENQKVWGATAMILSELEYIVNLISEQ